MAYLNYDKFALNQDEDDSAGDSLMGEDTDTGSDEGPLVEPDEWKEGGNDYSELDKESDEEE